MGFDWIAAPACTELELLTLDWLGKFLRLPPQLLPYGEGPGGAVIQGSAGEATVVVLLAAAQVAKSKRESPCSRDGMVVYVSDQTHAVA
jgi:glutamate/tyrosine decarboxylase-like PLP-dependent enzyme